MTQYYQELTTLYCPILTHITIIRGTNYISINTDQLTRAVVFFDFFCFALILALNHLLYFCLDVGLLIIS